MTIPIDNPLLTFLAVLLGAFISSIFGYFRSRIKISVLKKQFDQRLKEIYFKNAREHVIDLYRPLNKEISILYETFRAYIKKKSNHVGESDLNNTKKEFFKAFDLYRSVIDKIYEDSQDVYLVGSIESNMLNLRELIESSREEYSWTDKFSDFVFVRLYLLRPVIFGVAKNAFLFEPPNIREIKLILPSMKGFSINSIVFSLQFEKYVSVIKSEIKSVTLGEFGK